MRIDKLGAELKFFCWIRTYKTNYNAIFKERLKEEQIKERIKKLEDEEGKDNLEKIIKKSFKI